MKIETLKDLKEFLGTLNEEQLQGNVLVQTGDESGVKVTEAFELGEDYYQTDEGIEPVSTFDEDDDISDYIIVPAHTVYLSAYY